MKAYTKGVTEQEVFSHPCRDCGRILTTMLSTRVGSLVKHLMKNKCGTCVRLGNWTKLCKYRKCQEVSKQTAAVETVSTAMA